MAKRKARTGAGHRSKFEDNVELYLKKQKIKFSYEEMELPFVQPAKERTYTPDFVLTDTGVVVECKGKLTVEDRQKLVWIKEQYPDLRLVLLFMRASNTLKKGSKTTYAAWAEKNGFEWADWKDGIPKEWVTK